MLYALAVVRHEKFFNLAATARLFVERNTDLAIGGGHRFRQQSRVLTFDIEIADFAEVEQLLVIARPVAHAAPIHIVSEVVKGMKTEARGFSVHALQPMEINVVDTLPFRIAVDEVENGTADAANGR